MNLILIYFHIARSRTTLYCHRPLSCSSRLPYVSGSILSL